jgi:hypothetical protein
MASAPDVPINDWNAAFGTVTAAAAAKIKADTPEPAVREVEPTPDQHGNLTAPAVDAARETNRQRHELAKQIKQRTDHDVEAAAQAASRALEALGWKSGAVQVQGNSHSVQITVSRVEE